MQPKKVDPSLTVCAQITAEDVTQIAADGYRAIICNRPDGEAPDQPSFAVIEAAALAAGLKAVYQPITPGQCGAVQAGEFARQAATLPQPIFAYCRTGTRSITLWALGKLANGGDRGDITARAESAGYDVSAALHAATD